MVWKLLNPTQYVTDEWSGGTTTQLSIYPKQAVYANRDFLWRISSAKVEQETSVFTALPDYDRLISVLQGKLDLRIEQEDRKPMSPLEVRAFSGSDHVESWGVCRDFNLMVRKGSCEGEMHALRFGGKSAVTVTPTRAATEKFPEVFLGLYCVKGSFRVPEMDAAVSAGELLVCRNPEPLRLSGGSETDVMVISIRSWQ